MLKPENVVTKSAPRPSPAREVVQRCALCGEPCWAAALATDPDFEVQECPCSGRQKRRPGVADERLTPDAR